MGDVISTHLDEAKRERITVQTAEVMSEVCRLYEQQYAIALFNTVRFDIEGGGGAQPQLLRRKVPVENRSIFSGLLFQYQEENKKWRKRFIYIPHTYVVDVYENQTAHDKRVHPKGTIICSGYKVLTSVEQYLELTNEDLPGVKPKVGGTLFLKCPTHFPLILWHPFARHFYFCVGTDKEQHKWNAVLQDCVRHANDGVSEHNSVQTPAFTDAVRLYRQNKRKFGTWELMCGVPTQILANLVMEDLLPELKEIICPRLKGKVYERHKNWMMISDAVYKLVQDQCRLKFQETVAKCESSRATLEATLRTDMDQIITTKEHLSTKIRAVVLPKAEKLLKVSIEPYLGSILDALMEPTSRGFSEVRDVFFRELVDLSKNTLNQGTRENQGTKDNQETKENQGTKESVAQHMERLSMLAFHPVKMQMCYQQVEQLSLEGLQHRFDVCSTSVFVHRAQILMREQMDAAVYTFEQILHQSLDCQGSEELWKTIQRCQDRVIKKFDYDSSSVRKRFFREALLQIFIPYMLKQLTPSCASDLHHFQELIFSDFSRFILVENVFEEVVLQSVMKDIMMAVKDAAVQRKHNLYRDSIVLSNSDPSLHLLEENPSIHWAEEEEHGHAHNGDSHAHKTRRSRQVVSMIQVEGGALLPGDSCEESQGVEDLPEEEQRVEVENDVREVEKDKEVKEELEKDEEVKEELEKDEEVKEEVKEELEKDKEEQKTPSNQEEVKEEQFPSKKEVSETLENTEQEEECLSNQEVLENTEEVKEEEFNPKKEVEEELTPKKVELTQKKEVKEEELTPTKVELTPKKEVKEEELTPKMEVKEELSPKKEVLESPEKKEQEELSKEEELPLTPPPQEVPSGSTGVEPEPANSHTHSNDS